MDALNFIKTIHKEYLNNSKIDNNIYDEENHNYKYYQILYSPLNQYIHNNYYNNSNLNIHTIINNFEKYGLKDNVTIIDEQFKQLKSIACDIVKPSRNNNNKYFDDYIIPSIYIYNNNIIELYLKYINIKIINCNIDWLSIKKEYIHNIYIENSTINKLFIDDLDYYLILNNEKYDEKTINILNSNINKLCLESKNELKYHILENVVIKNNNINKLILYDFNDEKINEIKMNNNIKNYVIKLHNPINFNKSKFIKEIINNKKILFKDKYEINENKYNYIDISKDECIDHDDYTYFKFKIYYNNEEVIITKLFI